MRSARACPGGIEVLLVLGFPIGFASAGLMLWRGSRIGPGYAGLVALAWPALFLGLGWNFLEYGVRNPFGEGVELGWLIPGVIFIIMGGVPLVGWIAARGQGPVVPSVPETTTPIELAELASAMRRVSMRAGRTGRRDDDRGRGDVAQRPPRRGVGARRGSRPPPGWTAGPGAASSTSWSGWPGSMTPAPSVSSSTWRPSRPSSALHPAGQTA